MLRDCPIDHRCMTAISPDEVFERATTLLLERSFGPRTELTEENDKLKFVGRVIGQAK